jgi:hypothetical protein
MSPGGRQDGNVAVQKIGNLPLTVLQDCWRRRCEVLGIVDHKAIAIDVQYT